MSSRGGRVDAFANRIWYRNSRIYVLLLPLSLVFALAAAIRRFCYRRGFLRSYKLSVPVIVVGNISVGGTGKTPVTVWLADELKCNGMQPAIVSRGYGSKATGSTIQVSAASNPEQVGDEPVLLAKRTACPVFVNANRVDAAREAIRSGANVIISDDGLQHYRLRRDIEFAVVDGMRGFGNGHLLPAGPLREPESRLDSVERVFIQQEIGEVGASFGGQVLDDRTTRFSLCGDTLHKVSGEGMANLSDFAGQSVHAVAGISHPERFFRYLEHNRLNVIRHPHSDHAEMESTDVQFDDDLVVLVTEKDAVKCRAFAHDRLWYLPVSIDFADDQNMSWVGALHAKLRAHAAQEPA